MTALDQNFSDLANILMQRRQMQAQQAQQDRANRLSDLQFKQLQREDTYQTGLRDAMNNPGGSGVTLPQLQPQQPQQNTLASLAPGNQLPFPQPQASFAPVEAKMSPSRAGAEYALRQGKAEDAAKLINMDDALAQYAAKVQAGQGDPATYYKQKQDMDTYKQFVSEVAPLLKTPNGVKFAQSIAAKYQQMDPSHSGEYDLSTMKVEGDKVVQQVKDPVTGALLGHMISAPDGSQHYQKLEVKQDKPFTREYDDGDTRVTELYDASGKLTSTKKAPRYKPAAPASDKTDGIVAREVVKDLPKLRREARTAEASKPRLAQMISLLDNGAGGLKGNALAAVSGVFDTPATSEAELFKKLAAAGAGQLRTAVIGPGAVSNYEQSLLQAISGGGNGARTATRQLLKFYEQEADRTIANYNDAVDSAVTVAPKAAKGFGKLTGAAAPAKTGGKDNRPPLSAIFGTKR